MTLHYIIRQSSRSVIVINIYLITCAINLILLLVGVPECSGVTIYPSEGYVHLYESKVWLDYAIDDDSIIRFRHEPPQMTN